MQALPGADGGPVEQPYDKVAEVYDAAYSDPKSRAEDRVVFELLRKGGYTAGRVLDVGCGTGILLEHLSIAPRAYVGIDPSRGMLDRAHKKFPTHVFMTGTAEDTGLCAFAKRSRTDLRFDNVLSLYGSFNYCMEPELALDQLWFLTKPGGKLLLMVPTPAHERRPTYVLKQVGLEVPRMLYTRTMAERLLTASRWQAPTITGFDWRLADLLPRAVPDALRAAAMRLEMATIGRTHPDACCYMILTATKG